MGQESEENREGQVGLWKGSWIREAVWGMRGERGIVTEMREYRSCSPGQGQWKQDVKPWVNPQ